MKIVFHSLTSERQAWTQTTGDVVFSSARPLRAESIKNANKKKIEKAYN